MKAFLYKILLIFRDLFLHLHIAVHLQVGRGKVSKDVKMEADKSKILESKSGKEHD